MCAAGCVTHRHTLTGAVRPPVPAADVRIYLEPLSTPYLEIAQVEASSTLSWSLTVDAKTDVVIRRLQREAGSLGANGIILEDMTASGAATGAAVGVGTDVTRDHASFGIALFGWGAATVGRGTAIFVAPQ